MKFYYLDVGAANNNREAEWNLRVPEATYSLFEPDPDAFGKLHNLPRNNISNVLEIALGSAPGLKSFNICKKLLSNIQTQLLLRTLLTRQFKLNRCQETGLVEPARNKHSHRPIRHK